MPLFADLADHLADHPAEDSLDGLVAAEQAAQAPLVAGQPGRPRARTRRRPGGTGARKSATRSGSAARSAHRAAATDAHLRAAWRLSRAMGRYRDGSAEQTRAGLAICHHLQASLADAADHGPDRGSAGH